MMMNKISIALLFLSFVADVSPAQAPNGVATSNSSVAQSRAWRADLQYLAAELPRLHKNLFFNLTRQEFAREVARLDAAIPAMQAFEIRIAFMRLAALVGDSHTGVSWRREDFSTYPVQVYAYSDGWYVTATTEEHKRALGARLMQIGDTDITRAAATLRNLIPCENDSCFRHRLPSFINVPEFLYALRILPNARQGRFVFENREGVRFTLEMQAVTPQSQNVNLSYLKLPPSAREQTLWLRNQTANYWYEYLPSSKTLYLAYNRCRNIESHPFRDFAKEVLAFTDSHTVERFVIDMRRNGGGSEALLLPLIAELRRRPNINRTGRLFVVVGRGTFSSAAQNAITLKQNTQAIIVGEPTGQKPNHYGEVRTLRLPNSGLEVSYSTRFWKRVDGDPHAFMPDVLLEPSFADFSSGHDPALTTILEYQQDAIRQVDCLGSSCPVKRDETILRKPQRVKS